MLFSTTGAKPAVRSRRYSVRLDRRLIPHVLRREAHREGEPAGLLHDSHLLEDAARQVARAHQIVSMLICSIFYNFANIKLSIYFAVFYLTFS